MNKNLRPGHLLPYYFWLIFVVLLLSLNGCRMGSGGHDDAAVRLINAAPAVDDLSVAVDDRKIWRHSQFRSNTGFQGVAAGNYRIQMTAGQDKTIDNYLECQKGRQYTVVALNPQEGTGRPLRFRIFSDARDAAIPFNQARLRLINAGDGLGHVDALFNNIVGLGNVAYGARSELTALAPGTYDVKINATDEASSLVGPSTLHFAGGRAYTLVLMGRRAEVDGPAGLTLEAYPDDK